MNDKKEVQKALEDVKHIKGIIEETSTSMTAFSRIFIIWGILFGAAIAIYIPAFCIPVPGIDSSVNPIGPILTFLLLLRPVLEFLGLMFWPLTIFITWITYKNIVKTNPLKGISKQLMTFWIYILIFILVCFSVLIFSDPYNYGTKTISNGFPITSIELFVLGFGLLCTNIFTKLRLPLIIGTAYLTVGLYFIISGMLLPILAVIIIPITFLVIGIYFKCLELRPV